MSPGSRATRSPAPLPIPSDGCGRRSPCDTMPIPGAPIGVAPAGPASGHSRNAGPRRNGLRPGLPLTPARRWAREPGPLDVTWVSGHPSSWMSRSPAAPSPRATGARATSTPSGSICTGCGATTASGTTPGCAGPRTARPSTGGRIAATGTPAAPPRHRLSGSPLRCRSRCGVVRRGAERRRLADRPGRTADRAAARHSRQPRKSVARSPERRSSGRFARGRLAQRSSLVVPPQMPSGRVIRA